MPSSSTLRVSRKVHPFLEGEDSTSSFDVKSFLGSAGRSRRVRNFGRNETVFVQGDLAQNVVYIQEGSVKLSVVQENGKEAVVAILGAGDFLGEGCMAGQKARMGTATAVTASTLLIIEKQEMIRALHIEHAFSDFFLSRMLARSLRIEQDLLDQLFNSSEKRLARTLLLLAHYGEPGRPQEALPRVSQETLAAMVGTTRSRVNFFMTKFRKLGFIKYDGEIHVNSSLLKVVLRD
jgi:CRP/FNR family cyclic AMP-dependent transcriptional regulator